MYARKSAARLSSSAPRSPHISIAFMGSHSNEKQRLAVPSFPRSKSRRLLLIPACAFAIYLLSFLFHPSASQSYSPHDNINNNILKTRNYLATNVNQTLQEIPNPFEFCPEGGANDALAEKYGASNLARTRVHPGSGARVQRVLRRAMSGLPITISVLGGSISACHGAGDDPVSSKCWPSKFFSWWNEVFPHPASELTNGAMRKTESSYYAFCHGHHIPDKTDLIILDFDSQESEDVDYAAHFEMLIRSLLLRPDHPAIIILGHYSPQTQEVHTFLGPDTIHSSIAQFYDVPHISMKPLLYTPYVVHPDSVKALFVDAHLSSPAGHTLLAEVLEGYFQSQICQTWMTVTSPDTHAHQFQPLANVAGGAVLGMKKEQGGPLPVGLTGGGTPNRVPNFAGIGYMLDARPAPFDLKTRPGDLNNYREPKPLCVSANDLINPLPPSLFTETGWHVQHPQGSHTSGHKGVENAHYWYSRLPGSKLKVPVKLSAGDVGIYYMKEPRSAENENSAIECWVDDNYGGAVKIAGTSPKVGQPTPALQVIDRRVAKGSHSVECRLSGQEGTTVTPFRILGIFAT